MAENLGATPGPAWRCTVPRFEDTVEVDVLMSTAYAPGRAGDSWKALATILAPRGIRVKSPKASFVTVLPVAGGALFD